MIRAIEKQPKLLVLVGVALIIFSMWLWWAHVYNSPQRVFDDMLSNSLTTPSVTRHITQELGPSSLDQYTQLSLGAIVVARSLATITQQQGEVKSQVVTENLATPEVEFARYKAIDTSATNEAAQKPDFSGVLNVWGKREQNSEDSGRNSLLTETVLGPIPFANLRASERAKLLKLINDRQVYAVDFDNVTKRKENGRSVYVYNVKIQPGPYVALLQAYTRAIGYTVGGLDPAVLAGAGPVEIEVSVDKLSHQLTKVRYPASDRQEAYEAFGTVVDATTPQQSISLTELQQRLQRLQ